MTKDERGLGCWWQLWLLWLGPGRCPLEKSWHVPCHMQVSLKDIPRHNVPLVTETAILSKSQSQELCPVPWTPPRNMKVPSSRWQGLSGQPCPAVAGTFKPGRSLPGSSTLRRGVGEVAAPQCQRAQSPPASHKAQKAEIKSQILFKRRLEIAEVQALPTSKNCQQNSSILHRIAGKKKKIKICEAAF